MPLWEPSCFTKQEGKIRKKEKRGMLILEFVFLNYIFPKLVLMLF